MRLVLVGVSHRRAPVEVRERVALGREEAGELSRRLAAAGAEAVCLSTCNRTEIYLAEADAAAAAARAEQALAGGGVELLTALYHLHDEAAALHLFRVAAGLDSLVPGVVEILGQVLVAYESVAPGPCLYLLFRQ